MDIEIIAVGGYNEVGRNMTAVRVGKEIVIFDMGLRLDQIMIHEDAEVENMHSLDLIDMKAIPDDTIMNSVEGSVKAIVCTHGHLDHIGAVPKLAHRYNAPIIGTPYTAKLIEQQIEGEKKFGVENKVRGVKGSQYRVRKRPAQYNRYRNGRFTYAERRHSICKRLQTRQDACTWKPARLRSHERARQGGRSGAYY